MNKISRLALLVTASTSFVFGITGALLFFPGDNTIGTQAQGAGSSESSVAWKHSFSEGSQLAQKEHKYILADVYTDWCGWCKRLDRDVFPDPKLSQYLDKNFVCVKVNAEDPKEGSALANKYSVTGYPCALVFSPEGKYLNRIEGYEKAPDYMGLLKEITGGGKH